MVPFPSYSPPTHRERQKLSDEGLKPQEQLTLEPYERDHCTIVGVYRPAPKKEEKEGKK